MNPTEGLKFPLNELVVCPEEDYFAAPGINAHGLMDIENFSPKHFKAWKDKERKSSPAKELGKKIHKAIFENEEFLSRLVIKPACDRRYKEGKEIYEKFMSGLTEKQIVMDADEIEILKGVSSEIQANTIQRNMITGGKSERSLWSVCKVTGELMKCRLDWLSDEDWVVDLKTTKCAKLEEFMRDVGRYKYHIQAAWNLRILKNTFDRDFKFAWLAVEKELPFCSQPIAPSWSCLEQGDKIANRALLKYIECKKSNTWPGYSDKAITGVLPTYFMEDFPEEYASGPTE